jgi:DNA polymerase-3 subunit gamma/tau
LIPFASEDLENLKKASEGTSIEELLRYLIALQEGEQGLKFSSHPRIYLEALLVKLCHFRKIVPLTDILSDIKDIKKELKGSSVRAKTRDYAQSNYSVNERGAPPLDPMASRELSSQVPQPKQTKKEPALAKKELKKEIPTETPEKGTKQEREVDIAMKDPTVKNFMDTFKAQILSVEQIKKSKKE